MNRGLAIVEVSAPATGVPTVRLGSSVEPEEAWTLGRGRADVPGTGHTEDQTLDASLRTAPLRSMTGAECAALFKGGRRLLVSASTSACAARSTPTASRALREAGTFSCAASPVTSRSRARRWPSDGRRCRPRTCWADGRIYKLRRADRGHRVACFVTASNDGGPVLVGVASRLVR